MPRSMNIIGAGIAGLSAGCYGQMNGYNTRVFEMHNKPGGLCTAWKRDGYTTTTTGFLIGSAPGSQFYRFWEELGLVQDRSMINHEKLARVEGTNGDVFTFYSDIDRLEQHMIELAPEDKDVTADFIKAIHAFTRFELPQEKAPELHNPIDKLKMMTKMVPYLGIMRKWMGMSLQDFAQRFKNPFLREVFGPANPFAFIADPDASVLFMLITLASMHQKSAGYPLGGSLESARVIEQRYVDLGGEIHYGSPVSKMLVENNQAVGVRLVDGTENRSDIVISAADGRTTIFDMLDGKYVNDEIRGYYDTLPLNPSIIIISLGVARSFQDVPPSAVGDVLFLDEPITVAEREWKWLMTHAYNFDPSLAPTGKTLVRVNVDSDYGYWHNLRQDSERYDAEKTKIADHVIADLDRRFPGLADQVEIVDVATPVTFERFTGNWKGSFMGWLPTAKSLFMQMDKTLPGLESFYMVGQWVQPGGGLPTAATSGRHVTQIICKKDKRPFVTTVP